MNLISGCWYKTKSNDLKHHCSLNLRGLLWSVSLGKLYGYTYDRHERGDSLKAFITTCINIFQVQASFTESYRNMSAGNSFECRVRGKGTNRLYS